MISAIARVDVSDLLQTVSPFVLCFSMFSLAALFFCLLNITRLKPLLHKVKQHKKEVFYFNLATFGCWFFVIYPLKYLEPALVSATDLSLAPIFTLLLLPFLHPSSLRGRAMKWLCGGFFAAFIYILIIVFGNLSSLKGSSYFYTGLSIVSIMMAAFALSLNNLYAKRLSDHGFNPIENLAIRFFVLILLSAIIAKWNHQALIVPIGQWQAVIVASLLYAIIPLYLFQISIRALKPFVLMSIMPLMPFMTFSLESFFPRFHCSYWTVIALAVIFLLSAISLCFNYRASLKAQ